MIFIYNITGCISLKHNNYANECLGKYLIQLNDDPLLVVGADYANGKSKKKDNIFGIFTWSGSDTIEIDLYAQTSVTELTKYTLDENKRINKVYYELIWLDFGFPFERFHDYALGHYLKYFNCVPGFEKAFRGKKEKENIKYKNILITIDKRDPEYIAVSIKKDR